MTAGAAAANTQLPPPKQPEQTPPYESSFDASTANKKWGMQYVSTMDGATQ
jgi:hypothetical protein